jgi:hypothetical protein
MGSVERLKPLVLGFSDHASLQCAAGTNRDRDFPARADP